jgi:DNA-binding MarR family transcriptional regulator
MFCTQMIGTPMTQDEFTSVTREIRILLGIVSRIAHQSLEQRLNACDPGMSVLQMGVLRTLQHREHTISELSKRFVLDPSTLVPVIDTLERKGFVERKKDPNDRRRVPLALTEEGEKLLTRIPQADESDLVVKALFDLGEARAAQLLSLLRDLTRMMPEGESIVQDVITRVQQSTAGQPSKTVAQADAESAPEP